MVKKREIDLDKEINAEIASQVDLESFFTWLEDNENVTTKEMKTYLNQIIRNEKIKAANKAVAQYQEGLRRFKAKRAERIRREFNEEVLPLIESITAEKLQIVRQRMYQENRKTARIEKKLANECKTVQESEVRDVQLPDDQGRGSDV